MSKSERTLHARQRENLALSMRRAGATYQRIADALGYGNPSNAHRAVFRALDRIPAENVRQLRDIECVRLDALQEAHWGAATGGSSVSARIVLQVMERRARLLGLEAPVHTESTEHIDAEIATLAAQLSDDGAWDISGVPGPSKDDGPRAVQRS